MNDRFLIAVLLTLPEMQLKKIDLSAVVGFSLLLDYCSARTSKQPAEWINE